MQKYKTILKTLKKPISKLGNNFLLSPEQILLQETALDYSLENFLPNANNWDKNSFFPIKKIKNSAELGFGGINISEKYGGSDLNRLEASLIYESLSYGCISTTAFISIHNMVNSVIEKFGDEKQKEKYCTKLCSMDFLGSYCLTEPNSGSDAVSLKTTAVEKNGSYILNGSKMFISGAGTSDVYLVFAKTDDDKISAFIVEKNDDNKETLIFGKNENKMGWKSQPTKLITFDNLVIPKENLLGEKGKGFKYALEALNGGRVNISSCSLGGAQLAFDLTKNYTQERKQFGKRISDFQNTQFKMAEFATKLTSSRFLVRNAAKSIDEKSDDAILLASMAKIEATESCFEIVDGCLQLFGGYGYLHDYQIERILRDLRVHRILEGTNEIMKVIIARGI